MILTQYITYTTRFKTNKNFFYHAKTSIMASFEQNMPQLKPETKRS